ncbi:DUF3346 domain-containing protein [Vibrio chagasii]|nr:DUF3346 domain-containing protein [Vibrio chagasii]
MDLIQELRKLGRSRSRRYLLVNLWGYHLTITALIEKGKNDGLSSRYQV